MINEKIDIGNAVREEKATLRTGKPESIFQSVIIATLRHNQLNRGAVPRIVIPSLKTKKTRIAIDEVDQGLISYHSNE
jgi:DNA-directed RNA polymerase omega subunit